jgi:hypothetical protein
MEATSAGAAAAARANGVASCWQSAQSGPWTRGHDGVPWSSTCAVAPRETLSASARASANDTTPPSASWSTAHAR